MAKKVLIIEDEAPLAHALQMKLDHEGIESESALGGEEGISMLEQDKYSLILLDLIMPKIDGFAVLEQLRNSNWPDKNKPVIVFSNLGQESDIDRAKELGANDYLVKANLTPNQVVAKIREHLK